MSIVNKDKFVKDIASKVMKGTVHFEMEDRPSLMMGGRKVYVDSVSYDPLIGELTNSVSNENGDILRSRHGVRPLKELEPSVLRDVSEKVSAYVSMRVQRAKNIVNLESRLGRSRKRPVAGVSM